MHFLTDAWLTIFSGPIPDAVWPAVGVALGGGFVIFFLAGGLRVLRTILKIIGGE